MQQRNTYACTTVKYDSGNGTAYVSALNRKEQSKIISTVVTRHPRSMEPYLRTFFLGHFPQLRTGLLRVIESGKKVLVPGWKK